MLIAEPLLFGMFQLARRLPVALERVGLDTTPGTAAVFVAVVVSEVDPVDTTTWELGVPQGPQSEEALARTQAR